MKPLLLLISSIVVMTFLLLLSGAGALTADHATVGVAVAGGKRTRHAEELSEMDSVPYPQRRVLQGGNTVYRPLGRGAACNPICPGRGDRYTGRGCKSRYQCRACKISPSGCMIISSHPMYACMLGNYWAVQQLFYVHRWNRLNTQLISSFFSIVTVFQAYKH